MVHAPVSSHGTSAFLEWVIESANRNDPHSNFSAGTYFAVLGDSNYNLYGHLFIPPDLLATRIAPTAAVQGPLGSCGVYVQAEHVSLPSHDLDMLAVRIG
jgi:hypothetical protein